MNATLKLIREKVNIRWASSDTATKKEKKIMLNKTLSVLSVFFILMLAATSGFANDQLTGEAGLNSTALTFRGFIVRLQWYQDGAAQLRMTAKSQHGVLQVFVLNTLTRIDINGRIAGPKELTVGDNVTVVYGANSVASKVSVRKPTPGNTMKLACKIEEIKFNGPNYIFVMESLSGVAYYYELTVTPDSKLWRNGKPADPSEFQVGDAGSATFYVNNLNIISFVSISPTMN